MKSEPNKENVEAKMVVIIIKDRSSAGIERPSESSYDIFLFI